MAQQLKISTELLNEAMGSPKVRAALRAKAARVLPRAQGIAYAAGASQLAENLEITDGTRPGTRSPQGIKRPYVRIGAQLTREQRAKDRSAKLTARQIMRKAAGA